MAKNSLGEDQGLRHQPFKPLSLGPLYHCSISVLQDSELQKFEWKSFGLVNAGEVKRDHLMKRLQNLIDEALRDGCTFQELKIKLNEHSRGERYVDA